MTKVKRGTKRLCASCENKFYDLGLDPIICPLCEAPFVPEKPKPKPKPKAAAPAPKEEKVAKTAVEPAPAAASEPPAPDPEFITLEEVAAEEDIDEDAKLVDLGDDEVDIPPEENKDALLEDDEDESGAAVSGIIGGAGERKEEG